MTSPRWWCRAVVALVLASAALAACSQSPEAKKKASLERGQKFLKDGKLNEAVIELRNALQVDKDYVPALEALAQAYVQKSWYADAAREFDRAQRLEPDSISIASQYARALLELGAVDDVEKHANLILAKDPRNPDGAYLRAAVLIAKRKPKEALDAVNAAASGGGALSTDLETVRAEALMGLGKTAEAEQGFRSSLERNRKDARPYIGLGAISLSKGDYEEARKQFSEAKKIRPVDARVRLGLSAARERLGKRDEAIRELEEVDPRARNLNVIMTLGRLYVQSNRSSDASALLAPVVARAPRLAPARLLLGTAYLGSNKLDDALNEFEELNKQAPDQPVVQFRLGQALVRKGRAKEALVALDRAAKTFDKTAEFQVERGRAQLLAGQREAALKSAQEAQRLAPQSAQPYLLMGYVQSAAGNTKAARELFAKASEVEGGAAPAHLALGRLSAGEKDMDSAIKEFDLAKEADPKAIAPVRTKIAALLQQNRGKEALQEAESAASKQPKVAGFQLLVGSLYGREQQWDKSSAAFKKALELDPRSRDARMGLARVAVAQQKEDEAVGYLQPIIKEAPGQAATVLMLARIYERRAQYDQAIPVLEEAVKAQPDQPVFGLLLAELYIKRGRYDDAITRANELLGKNPDFAAAKLLRAEALIAKGDGAAASKDVASIVAANPKSEMAHYLMARGHALQGRIPEAQASYREALRLNPQFEQARAELAQISGQKPDEKVQQAQIDKLREATQKDPKNPALREELGRMLLAAGKTAEAQTELRQVLTLAPARTTANFLLALALLKDKNVDEAAQHLQAVLRTNPSHIESNLLMAQYSDGKGRREEAVKYYEAAVRTNPTNPDPKFRLGQLYSVTGRHVEALKVAEELEKGHPTHPGPPTLKGMVLIAQKKPEAAIQAFQSALKIQPKQFEAYRGLGQAYDMMGQADQAVASYQRALALHNDDIVVLNNLAWLLVERSNKPNEALPLAQKARDLAPQDPKVLDTLGWIHYRRGAFGEAEKTLLPAVEKARDDGLIHYHLGMAQAKGAKKCEAVPTLRRAIMLDPKLSPTIDPVIRDLGC